MNYIDAKAVAIAIRLGKHDPDMGLYRLYALLALTTGKATTLENVHDAWSAWRAATRPDHRSLVPFGLLPVDVQELDRKYMEAIHEESAP